MKIMTVVSSLSISLGALLSFGNAGYGQNTTDPPVCVPPNETRATAAVTPEFNKAFQEATPEARNAFIELQAAQALRPTGRIVGGAPVLFKDQPWQIAMIRGFVPEPQRSQFCGGSIIDNNWVLTAAHCVRNSIVREDPTRVNVVAGTPQYGLGGERLDVAEIHTHPNYDSSTMEYDFALLRLSSPVTLGQTVKLPDENMRVDEGTKACVTGWGATAEGGPGSVDLLGVAVPIVSNTVCNQPESYNGDIKDSMLCAGERAGGVDSCQGDSGGPFWTTVGGGGVPTLTGVVSWGEGCARRLKYGIYARVSAAVPWIASTTGVIESNQ
jgi:secreted trypsin-like serine protease